LLSGLVVLIDGSGRRWLEVGTVVVVAVVILAGFGLRNARSNGPDWSTQLAAGRRTCAQANHPATVAVPITPYGLGWYVTVPCGRLREYAVS
jgi:hypothetical protein